MCGQTNWKKRRRTAIPTAYANTTSCGKRQLSVTLHWRRNCTVSATHRNTDRRGWNGKPRLPTHAWIWKSSPKSGGKGAKSPSLHRYFRLYLPYSCLFQWKHRPWPKPWTVFVDGLRATRNNRVALITGRTSIIGKIMCWTNYESPRNTTTEKRYNMFCG